MSRRSASFETTPVIPSHRRRVSKAEFAAIYNIDLERELFTIERCGCTHEMCKGWQVVTPGREPLYPIPLEGR